VDAAKRGVEVEAILDKSQFSVKYSSSRFLLNHKIMVWKDDKVAIAHNKVIIIDKQTVITGSFNFTKAAQEKNAENLIVIEDKDLAKKYITNWEERRLVSTRVQE
jgi:phosphatidylserine/phosphatidylglycerophosphate/cardiolipin synthase-like enzyme